eukprot:TRINITY_DN59030_c0_g1_i1.p1 TRINITY_DN59030_c0_g1~~TRINITY_DN59030_c0_g1_i1.p1  ORF type:complete len:324 (-),score=60.23 TRINITY_DN59030_c0_g1_i1:8-919(-)
MTSSTVEASAALQRVEARNNDRLLKAQQARAEREESRIVDADQFAEEFSRRQRALQDLLAAFRESSAEGAELPEAILAEYRSLQQAANDAAPLLPQRESQRYGNVLSELLASIESARQSTNPRKKFAFVRKPAAATQPTAVATQKPLSPSATEAASVQRSQAALAATVEPREGEVIHVHEEFTAMLAGLVRCTVVCHKPLSASAFITDCRDCVFVLQAHQVRIHRCKNSHFYLDCGSQPIIEHCEKVGFAPLDREAEWTVKVNDFNWLRATPSPNWHVIPKEQRHSKEDLLHALPGISEVGVA